jgi:hypothetical protein
VHRRSQLVATDVDNRLPEPTREAAAAKGPPAADRAREGLLHRVVGPLVVVDDRERDSEEPPVLATVEIFDRIDACAGAGHLTSN